MKSMTSFEEFISGFNHEENQLFYEAVKNAADGNYSDGPFNVESGKGGNVLVCYDGRQLVLTPKALKFLPVYLDKKAQQASHDKNNGLCFVRSIPGCGREGLSLNK